MEANGEFWGVLGVGIAAIFFVMSVLIPILTTLKALGVLVQMAFQLGRPTLLEFTQTRQEILEGDWEGAADEMLDSDWASDEQTPQRARRMATAFKNNDASGWRQADDPYDGG